MTVQDLSKESYGDIPDKGRYCSNGVPDVNANTMISKYCTGVTSDMSKLRKGMAVWMSGHIGIYCGNGVVVESSPPA